MEFFVFPINRLRTLVYLNFDRDTNVRKILMKVFKNGGLSNVYKGMSLWTSGLIAQSFFFFSLLNMSEKLFDIGQNTAAMMAGAITCGLFYPIETLVKRYQVDGLVQSASRNYSNVLQLAKIVHLKESWKGFYNGFSLHLPLNCLGIYFSCFAFKQLSSEKRIFYS